MDMRNGYLYQTKEAAKAAGVPDEHIAEVENVVRVLSGPFKGRVYRKLEHGIERLLELEGEPKEQP